MRATYAWIERLADPFLLDARRARWRAPQPADLAAIAAALASCGHRPVAGAAAEGGVDEHRFEQVGRALP